MIFLRNLLRGWGLSFAVWGGLALLLATERVRIDGVEWVEALRPIGGDLLAWALITPLIFLLAARFPIEKSSWHYTLPIHLLAGAASLALVLGAHRLVAGPFQVPEPPRRQFQGPPWGPPDPSRRPELQRPPRYGARPLGPPDMAGMPRREPRPRFRDDWFFRMRLPLHLPLVVVLVVAGHAVHFYRRGAEREKQALELEASLAQARLDALKMQIQPHFLFNALNSIAALVHKDPEAADEMIGALSEFLRCTLHGKARHQVSLVEELEYVRRYLAIETVRFGDRLRCETDVPPETFGALVPMLILQPLVENAVRHGLSGTAGPARITITARRIDDRLRIVVEDNGTGFGPESAERIGLANTRARLRELHGEAAEVNLGTGPGCKVELLLPFQVP